jgi:beta-glucosidase
METVAAIRYGWRRPGRIADGSDRSVACDSYPLCHADIALLKAYSAKAYRIAISWPRVIPLDGRNDLVNQRSVEYYVKVVDAMWKPEIEPMVTLYRWDSPNALNERYGGLLNKEEFIQDFEN